MSDEPRTIDNEGTLDPLPGEAGHARLDEARSEPLSKKGLLALGLLALLVVGLIAFSLQRFALTDNAADDDEPKGIGRRPAAATAEPRRLEMPPPGPAPSAPTVPALVPTAEEMAEPLGLRRNTRTTNARKPPPLPEDAPVMLVRSRPVRADAGSDREPSADDPLAQTRRDLDQYQRRLQSLLGSMDGAGQAAAAPPPAASPPSPRPAAAGLFGGELQASATPRVHAGTLGRRSLVLPKGTAFSCVLKTRVVSATSGLVGCQVQRHVYGDDGRVLLIERGSHLDGEYRITRVRPGIVRIPMLWTRVRTPHGVTVELDSPGTGPLGESGIHGAVDNRWRERLGAAMLLSFIDDAVQIVVDRQAADRGGDTIVLPATTDNTARLAEKVLDSTINIPPLIQAHQGAIVGVQVARDVDFSTVYTLQADAP